MSNGEESRGFCLVYDKDEVLVRFVGWYLSHEKFCRRKKEVESPAKDGTESLAQSVEAYNLQEMINVMILGVLSMVLFKEGLVYKDLKGKEPSDINDPADASKILYELIKEHIKDENNSTPRSRYINFRVLKEIVNFFGVPKGMVHEFIYRKTE